MGTGLHEILGWGALAIIKFVLTPSSMIAAGYSVGQTILIVAIAASIGFTIFYFFGELIFKLLEKRSKSKKKTFTRFNRRIVQIKQRFGIVGLAGVCVIISVPISGLICARLFNTPRRDIPVMCIAFTIWTVALTLVSWYVKSLVNG